MKKKAREIAWKQLEEPKSEHEKVKNIIHTDLDNVQEYLQTNRMSNQEKALLFNLRSKCENTFRDNFHRMYTEYSCPMCGKEADSQQHALTCNITAQHLNEKDRRDLTNIYYSELFGNIDQQVAITQIYMKIINIRQSPPRLGSGSSG